MNYIIKRVELKQNLTFLDMEKKQIEELLTRGVENIYPSREALEKVLLSGKKFKLYQGFDPTGIQLHIGHMAGLQKLKQWQNLGHEVIFLIGDGTGQAGDPSGKTRARDKYLTNKELRENATSYVVQAGRIVNFDGPNPAKILYNGDWLNKLGLIDILNIANNFTLQQLEERDLYANRKSVGESISMREFLYPILQAYDSVAMDVDLELGGEDQTFNMLCGRSLVKKLLGKEKFVMTTPLLVDASGRKIGKTEGNVIALDSDAGDLYGLIMSLPDEVIVRCFEYITSVDMQEVKKIEAEIKDGGNPMLFKKRLAFELVKMLNDEQAAQKAQENFENVFSKREIPEEIEERQAESKSAVELLLEIGFAPSKSEARRLVKQNAVKIDGETTGIDRQFNSGDEFILKVGKLKFAKVKIK